MHTFCLGVYRSKDHNLLVSFRRMYLMRMLEIGRKRGCIISGGNIDEEKTARIILDEFKNGKLGKITLETPSDI